MHFNGYDNNGNRTSLRKRDGRIINYHYDALNRITEKDLPNTSAGDVYYGYDLQGLQTYAHFGSPSGSGVTTAFDGFGEVRSQTGQVGGTARTVSHQYDADGNLTRVTYPDGAAFSYVYNGLDQLTYLQDAASGDTLAQYAYDSYARPTTRTTAGNATATVSYDDVSRLATLDDQFASSGDNLTRTFSYNPASQISTQTLSNTAYRYTGTGDQSGPYVANSLNQYTSINGVSVGHDANGNLTAYGATTQYSYDVENRLTGVGGTHSATLSYDPNGRLSEASIDGSTTDFLYDGDALVGEYQGGSLSKRYVYAKSTDTPVVSYTGSGLGGTNRQFLYTDHQGSVIAQVDNNGTVQSINTYNAYGVPGNTNQGRFGYTGQMYLKELGLYHYRARVYDPRIGRFMQTDPVGYADQVNLYAYVGNDPLNNVDPTGMSKTGWLLKETASALRKAEKRLIKNARARGRSAALKNERQELIETGKSKSNLSPGRQKELIETGKLKNMDGHHEPSISSGSTIDEKVKIAENPDNITFMEKDDHQALHKALGGTREPIVAKVLGGAAAVLEFVEQNFPNTLQTLDALDPVGTMGMNYIEQMNDPCKNGSQSCI